MHPRSDAADADACRCWRACSKDSKAASPVPEEREAVLWFPASPPKSCVPHRGSHPPPGRVAPSRNCRRSINSGSVSVPRSNRRQSEWPNSASLSAARNSGHRLDARHDVVRIPIEHHAAQIKNDVPHRSRHGLFLVVADGHARRRFNRLRGDKFFGIVLKLPDAASRDRPQAANWHRCGARCPSSFASVMARTSLESSGPPPG